MKLEEVAIHLLMIKNKSYTNNRELIKDYLDILEELEKRVLHNQKLGDILKK